MYIFFKISLQWLLLKPTINICKMEVVSAEVNSLLPEEIMDTLEEDENIEAVIVGDPIPMETELEGIANVSSADDHTTTGTPSVTTEPVTLSSNCVSPVTGNSAFVKSDAGVTAQPSFQSGLQKLGTQTPVSLSGNQIILNKATDLKIGKQAIKQEGQKLIVTTLGKPGQPIVLALPHNQLSQKTTPQLQASDSKVPAQQFKVVTIGGRSEVKPVIGVSTLTPGCQLVNATNQSSVLQTQQLKAVQVRRTSINYSLCNKIDVLLGIPFGGSNRCGGQLAKLKKTLNKSLKKQVLKQGC